jgi:hypothetical protein
VQLIRKKSAALHPGHSQPRFAVLGCMQRKSICHAADKTMFPHTEIAADGRFLEFNSGDWFMMVGGFVLAGLMVWLI